MLPVCWSLELLATSDPQSPPAAAAPVQHPTAPAVQTACFAPPQPPMAAMAPSLLPTPGSPCCCCCQGPVHEQCLMPRQQQLLLLVTAICCRCCWQHRNDCCHCCCCCHHCCRCCWWCCCLAVSRQLPRRRAGAPRPVCRHSMACRSISTAAALLVLCIYWVVLLTHRQCYRQLALCCICHYYAVLG